MYQLLRNICLLHDDARWVIDKNKEYSLESFS